MFRSAPPRSRLAAKIERALNTLLGGDSRAVIDAKASELLGEAGSVAQVISAAMDQAGPGLAGQITIIQAFRRGGLESGLLDSLGDRDPTVRVAGARLCAALRLPDAVPFLIDLMDDQREVVDYLLATDVYVTPYLDPNQITSGTLAYALGAGKAIVSTPYLHAQEVLSKGRGILVPFRDAQAVASAVNAVLGDPQKKRELETRAYEYGKEMAWPAIGRRVLALMRDVLDHRVADRPVAGNELREELREEPIPIG